MPDDRRSAVAQALAAEGLVTEIDPDGRHVRVRFEGSDAWIQLVDDDPDFVRVYELWTFPCDDEAERGVGLELCNALNAEMKAVKLTLENDALCCAAELFCYTDAWHGTLLRTLHQVRIASDVFFERRKAWLPAQEGSA